MLCIAVQVEEVVLVIAADVVALDEFITTATFEANKFGITVPAAHSSTFHCCTHRRAMISILFSLTLPAFLLCCLRNIIPVVVLASCKYVSGIVVAIVESDFRLLARHSWRCSNRSEGNWTEDGGRARGQGMTNFINSSGWIIR